MCIDYPGRVIARDGDAVVVLTDGRRRRASALLFPDLAVGDWVHVAAGTVFRRLDPSEARAARDEIDRAKGGR
jgi:hydrogenase assembly chaperone HypC/HupF